MLLAGHFPRIWVEGEIADFSQPASGHCYFSLKDSAAQVRCALFRPYRASLRFRPGNGQQVRVWAAVGLYLERGDFQLRVERMEPAGEGILRLEFERLRRKLEAEGLFDPVDKRPLPAFPRAIGLLTSATGAAVRDLISVLGRRFPALPLVLYPARVQGEGAAAELAAQLALANRRAECELLILARGGGSLEDLTPFNDEALARAIRASRIPVVTGIGHETDLTLADLAADRHASTPSAAAELASPSAQSLRQRLRGEEQRLIRAQQMRLERLHGRQQAAARQLRRLHPITILNHRRQQIDGLEQRLVQSLSGRLEGWRRREKVLAARARLAAPMARLRAMRQVLEQLRGRLARTLPRQIRQRREPLAGLAQALEALSPLGTLARGYALVQRPDGELLREAAETVPGERIQVRLGRGRLWARVERSVPAPDRLATPAGVDAEP